MIATRRVALHRTIGAGSVALAVAMIGTGMVVIGRQMDLARQPAGSPFWQTLGPSIFITLVLFAAFYTLAIRFRRKPALHRLGLPVSILTEAATLILTPTSVGQFLAGTLADAGRLLAPLY